MWIEFETGEIAYIPIGYEKVYDLHYSLRSLCAEKHVQESS